MQPTAQCSQAVLELGPPDEEGVEVSWGLLGLAVQPGLQLLHQGGGGEEREADAAQARPMGGGVQRHQGEGHRAVVAESAAPHRAHSNVWEQGGRHINAVDTRGMHGVNIGVCTAAGVARTEGIHQIWQRLLPAALGAHISMLCPLSIASAVEMHRRNKVIITAPHPLATGSGSSEGLERRLNELPLGSRGIRHVNASNMQVVAPPASAQRNVAAICCPLYTSVAPIHSQGTASKKVRPDEDGSAATRPAALTRGADGKVHGPAEAPEAAHNSCAVEDGEVGFLDEDNLVAGSLPGCSGYRRTPRAGKAVGILAAHA